MPRDREKVRQRLQEAALELYLERGYDQTTASEIAARAGVTERTFFRHFPDKKEVLFGREGELQDALVRAMAGAPENLGPWDAMFSAFRETEQLFVVNRSLSGPLRQVVAASPALQERQLAKTRSLTTALASSLRLRSVPERSAELAAQIGMAILTHAVASWLEDESGNLGDHLAKAFQEVRGLALS